VAPSVQRRKVWLTPIAGVPLPCRNAAQTRNPLKFAGRAPNYRIDLSRYWAEIPHFVGTCGGHIVAEQVFFPIVDTCLNCEDIARQICAVVPRWRFFDDF